MKRELKITGDGSSTYYLPDWNEHYHSIHGAIQESSHIYIREGFLKLPDHPAPRIFEMGFGTGLNFILTYRECLRKGIQFSYHTVEKFPLQKAEYSQLNYPDLIDPGLKPVFQFAHSAPWNMQIAVDKTCILFKSNADIRAVQPDGGYDLVYFDAFAPGLQPELWSKPVLMKIFSAMNQGGIWVSYVAKGSVRRDLIACGFRVEKIPGPPGKREMIRAMKI